MGFRLRHLPGSVSLQFPRQDDASRRDLSSQKRRGVGRDRRAHSGRKSLETVALFEIGDMKTFQRSNVIYLDHHATTPTDPRVLEAMVPFFVHRFANAASFSHSPGRDAEERVRRARAEIAKLIGAKPNEIVFTS